MKAAVGVGNQILVVEIDRPPLLQPYIVPDRDQLRLMLHRPQRVVAEADEQLFPGEAGALRNRHLVAAVAADFHPVVGSPLPALPHLEARRALQRGRVAHQEAVARVRVPHHLVHFVHLRRSHFLHRQQLVIKAIARLRSQADPFVRSAAEPRIAANEIIHVFQLGGFPVALVRPRLTRMSPPVFGDRNPILEIQFARLSSAQRHRNKRPELVVVILVDGTRHRPPGRIVVGQKVHVIQSHGILISPARTSGTRRDRP